MQLEKAELLRFDVQLDARLSRLYTPKRPRAMARSVSPEQPTLGPQVAALRAHLAEIRNGVQQANESALAWKQKYVGSRAACRKRVC